MNSNGFVMKTDVISTKTENVTDSASAISNNHVGNGKIRNTNIVTMPSANAMSDRFVNRDNPSTDGVADDAGAGRGGLLIQRSQNYE